MKVIAICNQKGGAGKTSTAHALWSYFNSHSRPTLAVDLDAQCNLSIVADAKTDGGTALGVLTHEIKTADAIQQTRDGDIIAASPLQNTADMTLTMIGKESRLRESLEDIAGGYEYAIVDTAPHLGVLTVNALTAADYVVIPTQADLFGMSGIGQLWDNIKAVRKYCNPSVQVDGILLTRYNPRTNLSQNLHDALKMLAESMDSRLYASTIREATAVKEAQIMHKSIFAYAPSANVAKDYEAFCQEFLGGIEHEEQE